MLDLPYVAGIIDARAYIEPDRRRITVSTKRIELLEWLSTHTGVGVTLDSRPYQRRACGEHCNSKHQHVERQSAYWTCRGLRAVIICDAVLPWLVAMKSKALSLVVLQSPGEQPADISKSEIGAAMKQLGWPLPLGARVDS